ncbi:DUF4405 domain-containing protein [Bacillus rubiinfantis]|uniref:DUF4405 domain-containing protein n=1 Tax=Bacillus rubiinfantis TaxID=1499680 RepID=UPI0005AB8CBB|nr:DUF4405 domain-containing protein [Bacillus rubiinfantis]
MKKNYTKIIIDILMAITFVLLMNPRVLGGLPFHEIAGVVIGFAVLVHIGLNYRWVVNTMKKIVNPKLPTKTRLSFLLNLLLLITMAGIIITGILISRVVFPGLAIQGGHALRELHGTFADVTLALVGLHLALHWQWIMGICKKAFKTKQGKLRKSVVGSVVLSFAILAGGIQWYSTTSTQNMSVSKQVQTEQGSQLPYQNKWSGENKQITQQGLPNGEVHDGDFHGKEGHGGNSNPFLVMLNYFAIWAAIIIPAFFLEKRFFRKKRKTGGGHPLVS